MQRGLLILVAVIACLAGCRNTAGSGNSSSRTVVIGTEGGSMSLGDIELDVPPGALSLDTEITMRRTSDVPGGAVTDAASFEPEGISFDPPVTVRFDYDERDLDGAPAASLTVARASAGAWEAIPSVVDVEGERVMASLVSFSTYGVVLGDDVADGDGDADADGDGDADADGDVDGDADGDGDGDGDADGDCTHDLCSGSDTGCDCAWTCSGVPVYVWCSFTMGQCDCDGDEMMDCFLTDVPLGPEACGDDSCCY